MKITIKYCVVCNYLPIAAKLAIDIKSEFECGVEYEPGPSGVFDVFAGGKLIYSKFDAGDRFPKKDEIISLLKQAVENKTIENNS